MTEHRPSPPGSAAPSEHREIDYEIQFRTLVLLGLGTVALVVACALGVFFLYQFLARQQAAREAPPPPMEEARAPVAITGPRLLTAPRQNLRELREHEEQVLASYDWVDAEAGLVRVPIERAIELLAEREAPAEPVEVETLAPLDRYLSEAGSPPPASRPTTVGPALAPEAPAEEELPGPAAGDPPAAEQAPAEEENDDA